jgi:hypothetical protein
MDNFVVVHTNRPMPLKGDLTPLSHIWRKLFPYTFRDGLAPGLRLLLRLGLALRPFEEPVSWVAGSVPIRDAVIFVPVAVRGRKHSNFRSPFIDASSPFWLDQSGSIKLCALSLRRGRVVKIPLAHHVQWHPILYDRKGASIQKLNRAQVDGGLQVLMTLRATEPEHIVIRHICMVLLEDGRSATSFAW